MSMLESLPKSNVDGILYDAEVVHSVLPQKAPFAFVDEILSGDVVNVFGTIVAKRKTLSGTAIAEQTVAKNVVDVKIVDFEMDAVAVAAPRHFHARVVVHQLETLHFRWLPCKTADKQGQ